MFYLCSARYRFLPLRSCGKLLISGVAHTPYWWSKLHFGVTLKDAGVMLPDPHVDPN